MRVKVMMVLVALMKRLKEIVVVKELMVVVSYDNLTSIVIY
jgi:hypothetical protein